MTKTANTATNTYKTIEMSAVIYDCPCGVCTYKENGACIAERCFLDVRKAHLVTLICEFPAKAED